MIPLQPLCAILLALAGQVVGQLPDPPDGTPTGIYSGPYRPQLHFSPPKNFMNDPNGMFRDADGLWHLYYQWNYNNIVAGNQSWGHATSRDLYTWENHPVAILPARVGEGIFSGSAVVDENNTTGFFPYQKNGVVAIYTLNNETEQTQNIAFSLDGGYTFNKYAGNPVISIGSSGFRDPKVLWHEETKKWVMIVAHPEFRYISFYTSPNLVDWEEASQVHEIGWMAVLYECPGLEKIRIDGTDDYKWVMILSLNPGAPQGGSFTEYFIGDFNGTHFVLDDRATRQYSFGKDDYALQYFHKKEVDPAINIGWASNWLYTNYVPTGPLEGFRGSMTLPRETTIRYTAPKAYPRGYVLASRPYNLPHLLSFRKTCVLTANSHAAENVHHPHYTGSLSQAPQTIWFNITFVNLLTGNFTFSLQNHHGDKLRLGYWSTGEFYVDRGGLRGFTHPLYDAKSIIYSAANNDSTWEVYGIWDRSLLEVFVNDGLDTGVWVGYPERPLTEVVFEVEGVGNATWTIDVWVMEKK